MLRTLLLIACLAVGLSRPALAAPCVEGDADARALDLMHHMDTGATTLVGLSLWTGVMVKQSFAADLDKAARACARGTFEAGGRTYTLRGDNNLASLARVALPAKTGPIGYLTTAPDLVTAMSPGFKGTTAPVLGYALVTVEDGAHTTWRVYDKPPTDAVLLADFAEALSGHGKPMMRWRGGKIEVFTP